MPGHFLPLVSRAVDVATLPILPSLIFDILNPFDPKLPTHPIPTSHQQQHNSVPYLFLDKEEEYTTYVWFDLLFGSDPAYRHYQVVSLTWAKALASPLSHEFVQFIVEDTRNGARTRVFTDRTSKETPDRVIVGRDWSNSANPSGQVDMPLPLKSLIFEGQRPSVVEFASLLAATTASAPEYSIIFGEMCWWYARSVFEGAQTRFGGQVKEWAFADWAYDMIVWDRFITPRARMEEEARRFKTQNIEGMTFAVSGNQREQVASEDYLEKVTTMLEDTGTQKEYEEAMQIDGTEVLDPELLKSAIQKIQQQTPPLPAQVQEFEQASNEFTKAILSHPDRRKNMEVFETEWEKNMGEGNNDYERQHSGPGKEKKQEFDVAMRCFIGGVLRLMSERGKEGRVAKDETGFS